jgi:queuine tRNA-ribosyltransferase
MSANLNKTAAISFGIEKKLSNGLGRAGVIRTPHGEIKTPAFMVVGTMGQVKFVSNKDLRGFGAQAMLCNGYHLRRKSSELAEAGGLAAWNGWKGPTLTDSGGFQVMSLGSGLGKVVSMEREKGVVNTAHKERLAHVSEKGVSFVDPFDGAPDFIGPEESMQIQCRIGADIHMAFDELTSLADTYEYNKEAMARTERWAERSLAEHLKLRDMLGYRQSLYGVLQGGRWEDLRRATAKKLGAMEFDGYGLGGAFLKEDLGNILRWCDEELPEEKPRHLLGLSHPDDIFVGVEMGADTFDCVAPMREARHGRIYSLDGNYQLRKFMGSELLLDDGCDCQTCREGWTRGALRALWKSGELDKKQKYYNLATIHNVRFVVRLMEQIRQSVLEDRFFEFRDSFLERYLGHRVA